MSLLDSVKSKYKDHQDKSAELKDVRGEKLGIISGEFMGGYNQHKKSVGSLTFYQKQTEFGGVMLNKKHWFIIPNSEIEDIAFEGKDDVNRRVTVTRLLTVGLFAFALKKKSEEKEAFVTIELADGQEVIFHVNGKSPLELKGKLAKAISQVKQAGRAAAISPALQTANISVADELNKLAQLRQRGIITQQDFDKKKADLING